MPRGWPWSHVWKGTFWTFAFLLGQKSVKPTLDPSSKLAFEINLYPLGRNCSVFFRSLSTLDSEKAPEITVWGKMINENNSRAQVCVVFCNWLSGFQSLSPVSLTITEPVTPPRCCRTEECETWEDGATCPKTLPRSLPPNPAESPSITSYTFTFWATPISRVHHSFPWVGRAENLRCISGSDSLPMNPPCYGLHFVYWKTCIQYYQPKPSEIVDIGTHGKGDCK